MRRPLEAGRHPRSTTCSIAPKTLAPALSSTSMRIRSPKLMNGVAGFCTRAPSF